MNISSISSEFILPIENSSLNKVEPIVKHWCEASEVRDQSQFKLIYAVNEMTEGIIRLGTDLQLSGIIEFVMVPFSGSIEISITFPAEIPLDPAFKHNDEVLEQFPGMTISPDIFWHHIILNWIDKASWKRHGKKVTITLTQFARDPNRAGELYFLSIRPRLPESIHISYGKNNNVIVQYIDQETAVRLNEKASFVLKAVDGHTSVREIYYSFINEYGIMHPLSFGKIVEDLIERKLILTGDPVIKKDTGRIKQAIRRFLKLRYSFPEPDRVIGAINRKAGFLWSKKSMILFLVLMVPVTLWFIINYNDLSRGFNYVAEKGLHVNILHILILYSLYSLGIIMHELAHGIVCKRHGGTIHEMGFLVYFGHICPFVDTTDTWMFPGKTERISVSIAGPVATLILAYIEGILSLLFKNDPQLSLIFSSLFALGIFSFFINLIPWGETDGYFIVSDFFSLPNLRTRAYSFLLNRIRNLFVKTDSPAIAVREKLIYLLYTLLTPALLFFGLLVPGLVFLKGKLDNLPLSVTIILVLVFLALFFERVIKKAVHWYIRSGVTTINLKQQ